MNDVSPFFEVVGDHAVCRFSGRVSLEELGGMLCSAIALARERRIPKLLIVMSELTGFSSPALGDRYYMAHACARAAEGKVCMAVVSRPELIDDQKFGVTAARNAGMVTNVFTSEAEALAWLGSCKD